MDDILSKIVSKKKIEVSLQKTQCSEQEMIAKTLAVKTSTRGFMHALRVQNAKPKAAVIAEVKKASPSLGVIRADFDPKRIAQDYYHAGATCLSVLTDSHFFQGDLSYIQQVKSVMPLPVLRKDFIIDAYQIFQSKVIGADCILLIAAILDDREMLKFCQIAQGLGLDVLVEVHDDREFQRALKLPVKVIGVNNRNLRDFSVDIEKSIAMNQKLPKDYFLISESGLNNKADILKMQQNGINSFLIGGAFMASMSPGKMLLKIME